MTTGELSSLPPSSHLEQCGCGPGWVDLLPLVRRTRQQTQRLRLIKHITKQGEWIRLDSSVRIRA
jgi:hypothetical protein